jgi:hypothetical protein
VDNRPPNPSCLAWGKCEPDGCERDHEHHPDALDLQGLTKVEGKDDHYWAFVSLANLRYWIVPDKDVRRLIREAAECYLPKHRGHRPGKVHGSLHSMMTEAQLKNWEGKWETLGLDLV